MAVIHWFRQDLRLSDNPALDAASEAGTVLPIYILDDVNAGDAKMGAASRTWLHHSLKSLNLSLDGKLALFSGCAKTILQQLVQELDITAVYWNRCYEPWRRERDTQIKAELIAAGIDVKSDNGSLLWEPWDNLKADGTPYKVYTPFYKRGCINALAPREPLSKPKILFATTKTNSLNLDELNLLPQHEWGKSMLSQWTIGEAASQQRLTQFIDQRLHQYKQGRDFMALDSTSRLSPALHFGEVSPNQVWYTAKAIPESDDRAHFLKELAWREFSYSLLYHFPELPSKNLQIKFDHFPWHEDEDLLRCWQRGETGYPIVDAAMRELWQTGYMHNRARMIVGSFLVKNLRLHWRHGEAWFWDCLLDADLANNSASWQWIAGCGADAAPYFRIFNPVTQGNKFDSEGEYTLHYLPQLKNLPKKYLFSPWDAPVPPAANIYPAPIVDLKASREAALAAFGEMKNKILVK